MLKFKSWSNFALWILSVSCILEKCHSKEIQVNISTLGLVRGSQLSTVSGRTFHAFRGIPYAEPPVGSLRFKVKQLSLTYTILPLVLRLQATKFNLYVVILSVQNIHHHSDSALQIAYLLYILYIYFQTFIRFFQQFKAH